MVKLIGALHTLTYALVGMVGAMFIPATASAHPQHQVGTAVGATQPDSWVVLVMLAALGLFASVVGGATVLRITLHRRRLPLGPRTEMLLTSSMASCALIALVAFVATQLHF